MKKALSSIQTVQAILLACLLVALDSFAYNGSFSRLMADDYCHAAIALTEGVIGGLGYWYNSWSGRYTDIVLKTAFGYLNPRFAGILPVFILVTWISVASWAFYQITLLIKMPRPRLTALLISLIIIQATLQATPVVIQSLYWTSGAIPYTLPLICLTLYIGIFLRVLRQTSDTNLSVLTVVAVGLLTFLAGGLSEIYVTVQVGVIVLIGLLSWPLLSAERRVKALWLLGAGLAGAMIALFFLFTAPGNAVRRALFPPPPPLLELITQTIVATLSVISVLTVVMGPLAIISTLGFSIIIGYKINPLAQHRLSPRKVRYLLGVSGLAAILLITAVVVPSVYAISNTPPGRVFIIPAFILVCTTFFWGYIIGGSLQKHESTSVAPWLMAVLILLCLLGPLTSFYKNLAVTPTLQSYANEWDAFDTKAREQASAGVQNIIFDPFQHDLGPMIGLDTLTDDPTLSLNRCAADYYQVESLIVQSTSIVDENQ